MKYILFFFSCIAGVYPLLAQDVPNRTGNMRELRVNPTASSPVRTIYLTDAGKQGLFTLDPSDKSSPDDSAMTLVTSNGLRYKRITDQSVLNVKWFGATGNGSTDDAPAIQQAIDYIISSHTAAGRTLYFPPGNYKISKPLLIARVAQKSFAQVSINLLGPANAKDLAIGGANISPAFNDCFAIGVQMGKGVEIRNLGIQGRFTFPNRLTAIQIDTLTADQWTDGVSRQNPLSPYSGIVIDPFSDAASYPSPGDMYPGLQAWCLPGMNRAGSTAVQIIGCSIRNFVVGMMITPSNQQNGELIDMIDCDLTGNKVGYAMGQAQSKECHVERLKCWGGTHTLFDNMGYGYRHGDGANVPMVNGVNIAGSVKQLCRIEAPSFSGGFRNVYAEELYRLGYINANSSFAFEDCQLDFATKDPGTPYPDFFVLGNGVSFRNCLLRIYNGRMNSRIVLSGSNFTYEGGSMNEPPIAINVSNVGAYSTPRFSNVLMYYSGGMLGSGNTSLVQLTGLPYAANGAVLDPVYNGNTYYFQDPFAGLGILYKMTYLNNYERITQLGGKPVIHVDKSKWAAWFKLARPSDASFLRVGDDILTTGMNYLDQFKKLPASTYPVGVIESIDHDVVHIRNLADGIQEGMALELYMDYYVYGNPPFTGNIAVGSNKLERVQGRFPAVGTRPDMPMMPVGSYVTAVDESARTVSFSNVNNTGRAYADYTFMNGFPAFEMYSSFDPAWLQKNNKTLIGGADFYQYDPQNTNNYGINYIIPGSVTQKYKIVNTNFNGDTTLHKLNYIKK